MKLRRLFSTTALLSMISSINVFAKPSRSKSSSSKSSKSSTTKSKSSSGTATKSDSAKSKTNTDTNKSTSSSNTTNNTKNRTTNNKTTNNATVNNKTQNITVNKNTTVVHNSYHYNSHASYYSSSGSYYHPSFWDNYWFYRSMTHHNTVVVVGDTGDQQVVNYGHSGIWKDILTLGILIAICVVTVKYFKRRRKRRDLED